MIMNNKDINLASQKTGDFLKDEPELYDFWLKQCKNNSRFEVTAFGPDLSNLSEKAIKSMIKAIKEIEEETEMNR